MWQDIVIAMGQWFFAATLVPMWKEPPPLKTSVPTGIILAAFAFAFGTKGMFNATVSSSICGLMWLALAAKRTRRAT